MTPTVNALAPNVVTKNTGSKLCTSSEDRSMNRLTKPNAQIAPECENARLWWLDFRYSYSSVSKGKLQVKARTCFSAINGYATAMQLHD